MGPAAYPNIAGPTLPPGVQLPPAPVPVQLPAPSTEHHFQAAASWVSPTGATPGQPVASTALNPAGHTVQATPTHENPIVSAIPTVLTYEHPTTKLLPFSTMGKKTPLLIVSNF